MRRPALYRPITIRSIKDAEEFLKNFKGQAYIPCDGIDLCIEEFKDNVDVSWRWQTMRGNIFAPYLVEDDGAYCVYRHRKYVNKWQKGE